MPHGQSRPVNTDHYENFPVASVLCPPPLRPAVAAIYRFARTADDIADEGTATAAARLAELERYEQALGDAALGRAGSPWPQVFGPLAQQIAAHRLPVALLALWLAVGSLTRAWRLRSAPVAKTPQPSALQGATRPAAERLP